MHMKKLEIHGFKSFADKLTLEFDDGITAIVGPNGSGKSNVADAIRWVLGEQSVKTLRGAKMEDVIFAGTENRRPVSYAHVSITFDNTDNLFPIDYSEVCITRRVYRSGESEYYINKSKCRLKDILEMLMDTGIGKDGYSIIGQGQIEQIISTKPDDRRNIFEEAVGIVKYKSRKESAEKKLAEEKQNLIRLNDIISEIENQLEPLETQAEKTKKYIGLSEQLKTYEINQFINDHENIRERLVSIEEEITLLLDQIENSKKQQIDAKEKNSEFINELNLIEKQILDTRNEITDLKTNLEKLDGDSKLSYEKVKNLENENQRLLSFISESTMKTDDKNRLIEEKNNELQKTSADLSQYEEKLNDYENQLIDIDRQLSTALDELSNNKSEVSKLIENVTEKRTILQRNEILVEQLEDNIKKQYEELENFKEKLEEHDKAKNELTNKKSIFQKTLQEYSQKRDNYQQVSDEKKIDLTKLNDDYQKVFNDVNTSKARLKFLEDLSNDYEGYNTSVKKILQLRDSDLGRWNKIHGVVGDLIQVPKTYEQAIEVSLGGSIQNVVTEDENCAKAIIEYLKNNKFGRATFLPLNMVQERNSSSHENNLSSFDGFIGFANELIQYEPKYKQIISRLLGNVIVAKDFDSASLIAKKYGQYLRVVTLEGEQFNVGGSITGGSIYKKNSSILSRKREITELKEKITKGYKRILEKQEKLNLLKEEIEYNEKQYNTFTNNYNTCKQQLDEINQKLEQVNYLRNYVLEKVEGTNEEINIINNEINEKKQQITNSKEEIRVIEDEKLSIEMNYRHIEVNIEEQRKLKESLNSELTSIKIKFNELKQSMQNINQNLDWINKDIQDLQSSIDSSENQIKDNNSLIEDIKGQIDENKNSILSNNNMLDECNAKLELLEKTKVDISNNRNVFDQKIEECLEKINALNRELNRFENQKARFDVQLDSIRERMWEEYQLTYSTCLNHKQELGPEKYIKDQINDLRTSIKDLGNINMNAIEEFAATSERYDFLSGQKEDIIKAEEKLYQLIEELTKAMEEQFQERFKIISHEFNTVFQKLFGGGKGILRLSDEKDPLNAGIEIIASPPGKKLQSMTLMSGGEKALTAIALLFAIQKMNPSPFCVLDEIEAALDDYNIKRFADYLIQLTHQTQYLIITHRKGTMEVANALYGITMQEKGVSKSVSVKFDKTSDEIQYDKIS